MKINLQDAIGLLQEMRDVDSEEGVANALFKVGVAYLQRNRLDQAAEALEEAHYLCGKLENWLGQAHVAQKQAELALARGQFAEALTALDQALAVFAQQASPDVYFQAMDLRSRLLERDGRGQEAADTLLGILAEADKAGDEVSAMLLLQHLGPIQRRLGQLAQALTTYRRYGALAQKLGEPQSEALAYVAVGTLEAQLGRPAVALGALNRAVIAFEGLGMLQKARDVQREIERLGLAEPADEAKDEQ